MDTFVCGQRWVSMFDSSLGLGLVVQVVRHQVQILFPASGEMRTYATDNAPLKRASFVVGDTVSNQSNESFVVDSISEDDGLLTYHGAGHVLSESALADNLNTEGPESRLLGGHVDSCSLFNLRLATLEHSHRYRKSPLRGYTGARIDLLPHQLYIAGEVSRRWSPRVLLADEVGLGKTIEACLILHRLIVCGKAGRVLIILPDALIHQWFVELLRRFNLAFRVFNEAYCSSVVDSGTQNPFLDEQYIICGLGFLLNNEARSQQALAAGWDVVIVDEAHHLLWSEESSSPEYNLVEKFAQSVPGLLLLTASPEQTGLESHFARLRLLDPHRYPRLDQFVEEHDQYQQVAAQASSIVKNGSESDLQELLDRYGPGRVMFRNSRSVIKGFPKRIPHIVDLSQEDTSDEDPCAYWLAGFLKKNPTKKVLVICADAEDVQTLEDVIRSKTGIDIACYHEDLSLLQCDRQAAWFAEPEGPRILITSGMGGEGRNYQFASHMVLMDIPADPELIEQRIGRLDRIGQENDIHIYVPYIKGSPLEGRVRWLHEGLRAFERPLVGGYRMYLEFGGQLNSVTDKLISDTQKMHLGLCHKIESGRNILLELSSCRPHIAEALVNAIRKEEANPILEEYMLEVFEQFGVDAEKLDSGNHLLSTDLLFCEEFPMPRDRGAMQITFNRKQALRHPMITLLSWDHPMVQGSIDLILGSERGTCSIGRSGSVEGMVLQAVYVLEVVSNQNRDVEQFLPPTPIMVQVDQSLIPIPEPITIDAEGEPWWLNDESIVSRDRLPEMIAATREVADSFVHEICENAASEMRDSLGSEITRMNQLKKLNDHIRQEEIDTAVAKMLNFAESIKNARLRLDAIRLVV